MTKKKEAKIDLLDVENLDMTQGYIFVDKERDDAYSGAALLEQQMEDCDDPDDIWDPGKLIIDTSLLYDDSVQNLNKMSYPTILAVQQSYANCLLLNLYHQDVLKKYIDGQYGINFIDDKLQVVSVEGTGYTPFTFNDEKVAKSFLNKYEQLLLTYYGQPSSDIHRVEYYEQPNDDDNEQTAKIVINLESDDDNLSLTIEDDFDNIKDIFGQIVDLIDEELINDDDDSDNDNLKIIIVK